MAVKDFIRNGLFIASSIIGAGILFLPEQATVVGLTIIILILIGCGVLFYFLYYLWVRKIREFYTDSYQTSDYPIIDITENKLGRSGVAFIIFGLIISRFIITLVYLKVGFEVLKKVVIYIDSIYFYLAFFLIILAILFFYAYKAITTRRKYLKKKEGLLQPPIPERISKMWTRTVFNDKEEHIFERKEYPTNAITLSFIILSWSATLLSLHLQPSNESLAFTIYFILGCIGYYFFHYFFDSGPTKVRHPFTHQELSYHKLRHEGEVKVGMNLYPFLIGILLIVVLMILSVGSIDPVNLGNFWAYNSGNLSFENFFSVFGVIFFAYMSTGLFEIANDSYGRGSKMKYVLLFGIILSAIIYIIYSIIVCGVVPPAQFTGQSSTIPLTEIIGSEVIRIVGYLYTLFIITSASVVSVKTLTNTLNFTFRKYLTPKDTTSRKKKSNFSLYTLLISFIILPIVGFIVMGQSPQTNISLSSLGGYIGCGTFIIIIPVLIYYVGKRNDPKYPRSSSKKKRLLFTGILVGLCLLLFYSLFSTFPTTSALSDDLMFQVIFLELIVVWVLLIFYTLKYSYSDLTTWIKEEINKIMNKFKTKL